MQLMANQRRRNRDIVVPSVTSMHQLGQCSTLHVCFSVLLVWCQEWQPSCVSWPHRLSFQRDGGKRSKQWLAKSCLTGKCPQEQSLYFLVFDSKFFLQTLCRNWIALALEHTHTHNCFTARWILSGTTQLSQYQKKYSPNQTCRGHQSSLICFIHLLWSMAFSLFNPRTWQSFSTISLQVFFGLCLGLSPSTSYYIHFFTQSLSIIVFFSQHMPIPSQPV